MSYGDTRYMELEKLKKIAEQLLQGMSWYEQYYPYKNDINVNYKDFPYKKRDIMYARINLAYKVEKLLFQFFVVFGHTKINTRMLLVMYRETGREHRELAPIVQAFLKAGWTHTKHIELTRDRARKAEELSINDAKARGHPYKEDKITIEKNPWIDYKKLENERVERLMNQEYIKEKKQAKKDYAKFKREYKKK